MAWAAGGYCFGSAAASDTTLTARTARGTPISRAAADIGGGLGILRIGRASGSLSRRALPITATHGPALAREGEHMAAPTTTAQFLELIRKSSTVAPKRLDDYLAALNGEGRADQDPKRLAARLVRDGLLTAFQAEQLLIGKWRGFSLGKYRILERLGAGGMGAVFLCEHTVMGHRVAVKVLPTERANDPAALGRFYREARAAAGLDHVNIVRAYDIDRDGDRHFLVMEYVDGASLQDLVSRRGPLDVLRAVNYVRQAALGLQRAHEAGLVHRDVKPGNLLLDRVGTVKVADLGLARFFHDDSDAITREQAAGTILGSADYFAPEQAVDCHQVDIRGDIYALGCTFYFLLTGHPPFEGGTVTQKLLWHQIRTPQPVRDLRPEVPAALALILDQMLAKEPAKRFQTPAAVAHALERWTVSPLPPPPEADFRSLSPAAQGALDTRDSPGASGTKVVYPPIPEAPGTNPDEPEAPAPDTGEAFAWDRLDTTINYGPPPPEPGRPGGKPSARRLPAPEPAEPKPARSWQLPAVLGVALFGVGLGIAGLWRALTIPTRPGPARTTPGMPNTSAGAMPTTGTGAIRLLRAGTGSMERYETLWAALGKAKPGDRLVVHADTLDEPLILRGDGLIGTDVSIEGRTDSGRPVLWRPPVVHGAEQPLVSLENVSGLRLTGFDLDGRGQVQDLVVLSDKCPGLTLDGVSLRGYTRSAVRLQDCAGAPFRPVTLKNLAVTAGQAAETALLFEAGTDRLIQHVEVRASRFVGPFRAAVRIAGPLAHTLFLGNRFFRGTDGFRFSKSAPSSQLHAALVNNTIAEFVTGLSWEALPDARPGSFLAVRNNLFLQTKTLAQSPGQPPAHLWPRVLAAAGNVRDEATAEGVPPLLAQAHKLTVPVDPAQEASFLRYPVDSPLTSAGTAADPVGAAPPVAPAAHAVVVHIALDGQERVCSSVRDALLRAKPQERVVVRGEVLEESLVLWGSDKFAGDIHLAGESPTGRPVTWRVPAGHPPVRPLLSLIDLVGFTVTGFHFDGRDRVNDLVVLGGFSPGSAVTDCQLHGFRRHGLILRDCAGLPDRPVLVRDLRITTLLGSDAAVAFQAQPDGVNQFINIRECRLEGPYHGAVHLGAPTADVMLENNRIHRAANGLVYHKAEPRSRLHTLLSANTFLDVRRIVHCEAMPAADNGSQLRLLNNLFVRSERLAEVDGLVLEPDKCAANWVWFPDEGDPLAHAPGGTRFFRKTFELPKAPTSSAVLNVVCDDSFTVWLSGKEVGKGSFLPNRRQVFSFNVTVDLEAGRNALAIEGTNRAGLAGLLVHLVVRIGDKEHEIITDGSWRCARQAPLGWQALDFKDTSWQPVRVVASYEKSPPFWRPLMWDWLPQRLPGQVLWPLFHPSSTGNVSCDGAGLFAGPSLLDVADGGSAAGLGTDPQDKRTFLRYPHEHPLARAGTNNGPVGVPPP